MTESLTLVRLRAHYRDALGSAEDWRRKAGHTLDALLAESDPHRRAEMDISRAVQMDVANNYQRQADKWASAIEHEREFGAPESQGGLPVFKGLLRRRG